MMETMIPPQVRDETPNNVRRRKKKKRKNEKMKKKNKQREKGHCKYPLPHLVFKVAPCFFIWRVSYVVTFIYQWNISLQDQMHTHLVFIWTFHTLIALSVFVAWQSLLLILISIDGHPHSPLVSRVDVRLCYFFVFFIFTPIIILYFTRSAISIACTHVLREG